MSAALPVKALPVTDMPAKNLPSPPASLARPRMLRVEVNGLLHDWFDIEEMGQFVRSPTFSSTLRENIARYFGVPVKNQAIYDEDGLLTTSADFSRALQRFTPKLYIYDAQEMGPHLRERTSEQLAMIDAEVEQSRRNFRMSGSKSKATVTPRQRKNKGIPADGIYAEGMNDGAPEITPVNVSSAEASAHSGAHDAVVSMPALAPAAASTSAHGTLPAAASGLSVPEAAPLTASASSVETMHIDPAPLQPSGTASAPVRAPLEVPVERVAWPSEGASAKVPAASSAHTTQSQDQPRVLKPAVVIAPQGSSFCAPAAVAVSITGAATPSSCVLRPSVATAARGSSVRTPSAPPGPASLAAPAALAVSGTAHTCQASLLHSAAPPGGCRSRQLAAAHTPPACPVVARGIGGASQGLACDQRRPGSLPPDRGWSMGRSLSPQPMTQVMLMRSTTPVRVKSQVRLEPGGYLQPPAIHPPPVHRAGCGPSPQHLHLPTTPQVVPGCGHVPQLPATPYSQVTVGISAPAMQLPILPQQGQMGGAFANGEDSICRDGVPSTDFVQNAGRFFGFVDQLQKRGCRKPRSGSAEGTRNVRQMQAAAQHGVFEGEVENIWN
mmetsp:Transcript_67739/g.210398  ORF Transcript_67739/g.210398 Transcript_67739/m.210398 type:complete len:610 (+) Transcript_67739:160-1989(+)